MYVYPRRIDNTTGSNTKCASVALCTPCSRTFIVLFYNVGFEKSVSYLCTYAKHTIYVNERVWWFIDPSPGRANRLLNQDPLVGRERGEGEGLFEYNSVKTRRSTRKACTYSVELKGGGEKKSLV